ncbi:hypothetical protein ES703_72473 [subsurface metagenome]
MNILVVFKGFDQTLVVREVSKSAEVNLRVISTQQVRAKWSNKRLPDLFSQLTADGDILQIGVT